MDCQRVRTIRPSISRFPCVQTNDPRQPASKRSATVSAVLEKLLLDMTMKSPKFQDISSYPLLGLVPSETAHNTYLHLDCGYIYIHPFSTTSLQSRPTRPLINVSGLINVRNNLEEDCSYRVLVVPSTREKLNVSRLHEPTSYSMGA